jgi:hypothetical protein
VEVNRLLHRCGSYAKAAHALGLPGNWKPVLSMTVRGVPHTISRARENDLRARLNLYPLGVALIDRVSIRALAALVRNRTEVSDVELSA